MDKLDGADVKELAIHRRVSRLDYSRRCAEASAVQAHMKQGLPLAPEMEISYVVKDAKKWEVDPARTASEFELHTIEGCYRRLGRWRRLCSGSLQLIYGAFFRQFIVSYS